MPEYECALRDKDAHCQSRLTDTQLGCGWKQRAAGTDIPSCAALRLSLSSVMSLQRDPLLSPPHHYQPTLLTTHQGGTLITYLMTGASFSVYPSLFSRCLVTNEPGLANKCPIDSVMFNLLSMNNNWITSCHYSSKSSNMRMCKCNMCPCTFKHAAWMYVTHIVDICNTCINI